MVEAKQRIQLQKTNTPHLLILSFSYQYPPPAPRSLPPSRHPPRAPDPKNANNVVKLHLSLQPVKQWKPGPGSWEQQQQHRSPAPQQHRSPAPQQHRSPAPLQHTRTRLFPSVLSDSRRQLGDSTQHPRHNPPFAR